MSLRPVTSSTRTPSWDGDVYPTTRVQPSPYPEGFTPLAEANSCHKPGGSPDGGQFCSGKGSGSGPAGGRPSVFDAAMTRRMASAVAGQGDPGPQRLDEWERDSPYRVTRHPSGAMSVPYGTEPHFRKLWNLQDYRVSSVTGGSVWLIPKKDPTMRGPEVTPGQKPSGSKAEVRARVQSAMKQWNRAHKKTREAAGGNLEIVRFVEALVCEAEGTDLRESNYLHLMEKWSDAARAAALAARRAKGGGWRRAAASAFSKVKTLVTGKPSQEDRDAATRLMNKRRETMAAQKKAATSSSPLDQRLAKMHAEKIGAIDRVAGRIADRIRKPRSTALRRLIGADAMDRTRKSWNYKDPDPGMTRRAPKTWGKPKYAFK